jgi:hypothetical protein
LARCGCRLVRIACQIVGRQIPRADEVAQGGGRHEHVGARVIEQQRVGRRVGQSVHRRVNARHFGGNQVRGRRGLQRQIPATADQHNPLLGQRGAEEIRLHDAALVLHVLGRSERQARQAVGVFDVQAQPFPSGGVEHVRRHDVGSLGISVGQDQHARAGRRRLHRGHRRIKPRTAHSRRRHRAKQIVVGPAAERPPGMGRLRCGLIANPDRPILGAKYR